MYSSPLFLDTRTLRLDNKPLPQTFYQHGWKDVLNIAFYSLVWIIIHALVQEYIWEVNIFPLCYTNRA